jgi:hypothetical protein
MKLILVQEERDSEILFKMVLIKNWNKFLEISI